MDSLMRMVVENYDKLVETKKNPSVDTWPFMQSATPVIGIIGLYLYFVLKLGPQLMKDRPGFNLQKVLIAYNAYQVVFCIWLCFQFFKTGNILSALFPDSTYAIQDKKFVFMLSNSAWWYFFSRMVELLDTVFFVLRKKQSHVTFLHVYHHSLIVFLSWFYLKYLLVEQAIIVGFLNTGVHIVMYFYYLIAALGPEYKKYLWWKKYMTWTQMIQFLLYFVYIFAIDNRLPKAVWVFYGVVTVVFLFLFGDYYKQEYGKKNKMNLIEKVPITDKKLE